MALEFPSDKNTYDASMKFTVIDRDDNEGETCDIYLPVGTTFADRIQYENMGLGAFALIPEGEESIPQDILSDPELKDLVVGGVLKKFSDKAGAAAAERNKVAPNPNTRALFKQVALRSFQFTFKMIPTSEDEEKSIGEIVKYFRTEMYPEEIGQGAGGSLGYKFPNRFKVEMFGPDQQEIGQKIAPAYLESFTTNYNPSSMTFFRKSGGKYGFSEVDISLTLTESKTLNRNSIGDGF